MLALQTTIINTVKSVNRIYRQKFSLSLNTIAEKTQSTVGSFGLEFAKFSWCCWLKFTASSMLFIISPRKIVVVKLVLISSWKQVRRQGILNGLDVADLKESGS